MLFTPLAVPPIPNKEQVLRDFKGEENFVWWGEETLLGDKRYNNPLGHPQEWTSKGRGYPELMNWIRTYLPFEELWYIRIARAQQAIPPHVDGNKVEPDHKHHLGITQEALDHLMANEPVGYRFIISGSRKNLYLCKEYDYFKDMSGVDKYHTEVPSDTDAFLLRNQDMPHGVDEDTEDRLVGFILGKVHEKAHQHLIAQSIKKYSDYVMRTKDVFDA